MNDPAIGLEQIIERLRNVVKTAYETPSPVSVESFLVVEIENAVEDLTKFKAVIGAVTPGLSARQVILERMERLARGESPDPSEIKASIRKRKG